MLLPEEFWIQKATVLFTQTGRILEITKNSMFLKVDRDGLLSRMWQLEISWTQVIKERFMPSMETEATIKNGEFKA